MTIFSAGEHDESKMVGSAEVLLGFVEALLGFVGAMLSSVWLC